MASLFGAVPLAFGTGMGAELRQPLGIAIIGGLMVSQLLTLYTTPVIYLVFDRILQKLIAWHAQTFNPALSASGGVMNLSSPFIKRPIGTTLLAYRSCYCWYCCI